MPSGAHGKLCILLSILAVLSLKNIAYVYTLKIVKFQTKKKDLITFNRTGFLTRLAQISVYTKIGVKLNEQKVFLHTILLSTVLASHFHSYIGLAIFIKTSNIY